MVRLQMLVLFLPLILPAKLKGHPGETTQKEEGKAKEVSAPSFAYVKFRGSKEDSKADIYLCEEGRSKQITDGRGNNTFPAWSPDGKKLAFSSDRTGSHKIYSINADGTGLTQLSHDADNIWPAWCPDGQEIAFLSRTNQLSWLATMKHDGSKRTSTHIDACPLRIFWSPDGKEIAVAQLRRTGDKPSDIFTVICCVDLKSRDIRQVTDLKGMNSFPTFSPDGKTIAFMSTRHSKSRTFAQYEIYLIGSKGENLRRLTHDETATSGPPSWSPDGKEVIYSRVKDEIDANGASETSILSVSVDGSKTRELLTSDKKNRIGLPMVRPIVK